MRTIFYAFVIVLTFAAQATAETKEDVVLTVTLPDRVVEYSLTDLRAFDGETFETNTIWSDGSQVFTGVSLQSLLTALDVTEGSFMARAINDYAVEIPVSDAVTDGPILAYERNGSTMSVRDKGPLWLVYPYDLNPDYMSEVIYSRSIWQLDRIEILP